MKLQVFFTVNKFSLVHLYILLYQTQHFQDSLVYLPFQFFQVILARSYNPLFIYMQLPHFRFS